MSDITDAGPRLKAMNDALETASLRLTDAEREAVVRAWHSLLKLAHHEPSLIDEHLAGARALNALLERTRNG
jgi:hypothetical protein